jgi:hypothetical protein
MASCASEERTLWWLETHRGDADSTRSVAAIRP